MQTYKIGQVAENGSVTFVTKYWMTRGGARAKQVSLFAAEPEVFWLIGYEYDKGYFLEAADD